VLLTDTPMSSDDMLGVASKVKSQSIAHFMGYLHLVLGLAQRPNEKQKMHMVVIIEKTGDESKQTYTSTHVRTWTWQKKKRIT